MKILRLILGDQLNAAHSWFKQTDANVSYVMMEMRQETDYTQHHIQKIVAFFASMRNFASERQSAGYQFIYFNLDSPENLQSLTDNLSFLIEKHGFSHFEYQLPDEYRLDNQLKTFCDSLGINTESVDSEHFMSERNELETFFKGKKTFLMESFYRAMRRKHNVMVEEDGNPWTGQWNYDADNRATFPKNHRPIEPLVFDKNVSEIHAMIRLHGVKTIGVLDEKNFIWPTSRAESLQLLAFFMENCLPFFGKFQDAMTTEGWSLYHARISFSMNSKMLSPLEVIHAAIATWQGRQDEISFAQLEGFVRQIIGWREYMRGVYWAKMPDYQHLNFFNHDRKLPDWFWTGQTKMACLKHSIQQSLTYAYAHHIQRLMVTGNFALLAGIHPDEIDQWYLGIYIDAIEWVEITNTRGMSQFADGGIVGTKPYVSSANYIDKMSTYCTSCFYDKKIKIGDKACPFNSLYWHFYDRHVDKLARNPRIGMMYQTWKKMDEDNKTAIIEQAEKHLKNIESL
jgi:deoxyribodipyrimidine photolyase-related protein